MNNRLFYMLLAAALLVSGSFILLKSQKKALRMAVTTEEEQAFFDWKSLFNKNYESMNEHTYRLSVFVRNVHDIIAHNSGESTYTKGINQFSDLTKEEFKSKILMTLPELNPTGEKFVNNVNATPSSVDWRGKAVTPVKDQGQCGSCWSFSTTGVMEGTFALNDEDSSMLSFAEQQLVDCCGADGFGCQGCEGAWPYQAASYIEAKGIVTEDKYPYTAMDGTCSVKGGDYKTTNHSMIEAGNLDDLAAASALHPVSVCVDATNWSSYSSGVFDDCSTNIDHAVLLVGYSPDYWIVKNSWNTSWGEQGYIRLARGNTCAIANVAMTTTKQ